MVSDNRPQYTSQALAEFAKVYEFRHITSSPYFPQWNGEAERAVGPSNGSLRREEICTRHCWPIGALPCHRLDTVPHSYSLDVCCGPPYPLVRHREGPSCQIWQGSERGTVRGRPDTRATMINTVEHDHCLHCKREIGCGSLSVSRREKLEKKCLHSHTQWRQKETLSVVTDNILSVSHIQREQRTPLNQLRKTQVRTVLLRTIQLKRTTRTIPAICTTRMTRTMCSHLKRVYTHQYAGVVVTPTHLNGLTPAGEIELLFCCVFCIHVHDPKKGRCSSSTIVCICTYCTMYVCYVCMLCMYAYMYLVCMCRATYIMYGCCKNNQLLSHSTLVALASTLSVASTLLATTTLLTNALTPPLLPAVRGSLELKSQPLQVEWS